MKKIVLIVITVMVLFGFAACDLINPDVADAVINDTRRDNPLDSGFWDIRSSFPVEDGLGYPVTFVIDGKGYAGLGTNWSDENNMLKEFRMYDPDTNEWTRKKDYPGNGKQAATAFVFNGEAYIAGGFYHDIPNDKWVDSLECWKYNPVADSWTEMASISDQNSDILTFNDNHWSAVYEGKGYMSTTSSNDYFIYDLTLNSWEKKNISYTGEILTPYSGGFIHNGDGCKIYAVSVVSNYSISGQIDSFDGFKLYSHDLTIPDTSPSVLYSEQLLKDDYPVGIKEKDYEGETHSYLPYVTLFTIGSKLYMFSSSSPGTDLISFNLDGSGTPEHLGWPSGLTNGDDWCTYPMIFDDKVYILDEGGSFYLYKL